MSELETTLRETARQLLVDEQVDLIIGYATGTLPLRTTPCFVDDPEHVEQLVWNSSCENTLATYLQTVEGKVGIVAKGCDARAIVTKIVEHQVDRENVVIIGVPCQGVIDRQRIESQLGGREILEALVTGGHLVLRGIDADTARPFEETLDLQEALCGDCVICRHKNPAVYDVLIGDEDIVQGEGLTRDADGQAAEQTELAQREQGERPTVEELESWSADERWAYFTREFDRCIRCYACREACPACYCTQCFVDQSQPDWFGKSDDSSDVMAFHLVRIYHVAGRCLDCGACDRACPMHIDLRTLGRKLEKDVRELFGYEPGMDLESAPLLGTYQTDDPQGFIK